VVNRPRLWPLDHTLRNIRATRFVSPPMTNLRLAIRLAVRQPLVSALAVVALALGIGLSTLMFSILNGAVLRGLPFERSERILHVSPYDIAERDDFEATQWEFAEWRARQNSFDAFTAFYVANANVVGPDGTPERYRGAWITPNTLGMLRTRPALGRDFQDADGRPGAEPVVIISDRVWRDRFDGRADVLGQALRVNGTVMTVVGVMEETFAYPIVQELWVALVVNPSLEGRETRPTVEIIGRLKDEATQDQASAELATIAAQVAQLDPKRRSGITVEVKPYVEEFIGSETVNLLSVMLAAVLLVLVIACVNVANLVLARAVDRTREVAVRTALGAQRTQVIRQTLAEVLVLAAIGAAGGVGIAYVGARLFTRGIVDTVPPFWIDVRLDGTVLLFVTAVTVLAALVAGLVPALRASRGDVLPLLNDEGRGSTSLKIGRLSRGLVIGEMALSFALLVVSGLVIRSIVNVSQFDPGIATRDVLTARLTLPAGDYPDGPSRNRFGEALLGRLRTEPGIRYAALSTTNPPTAAELSIVLPGQSFPDERDYPRSKVTSVSDGLFEVIGAAPRQGRIFTTGDGAEAPKVAVVNEAFQRRHYPDGALGRQVRTFAGTSTDWHTIVGVVQDIPDIDLGESILEHVYFPLPQRANATLNVLLRTDGEPTQLAGAVRRAVAAIDHNLPIYNVHTIQKTIDDNTWGWRVFGTLFSAFGVAALFLATVGLYGVMAFSVSKRTQEIGVRMAVGAESGDVLRMVLRQGAWQVGAGVALGLGLAMVLANAMRLMFFQVSPYDSSTFIAVALLLLVTGLAAAFVPARRAARVAPMAALRVQ
jgi:putative ABC transport system permease protein